MIGITDYLVLMVVTKHDKDVERLWHGAHDPSYKKICKPKEDLFMMGRRFTSRKNWYATVASKTCHDEGSYCKRGQFAQVDK